MSSGSTRHKGNSPRVPLDPGSASIPDDIGLLSRLVHELEDQLRRLGSMNDALEHDLEEERARTTDLERHIGELEQHLVATGNADPGSQDLLEKSTRASAERAQLFGERRLLERRLRDLLEAHPGRRRRARRLREELAGVEIELRSVESQLSRAMAMVAGVDLQLGEASAERNRLTQKVNAVEQQVGEVRRERDALAAEVAESRLALQELQQQLRRRL